MEVIRGVLKGQAPHLRFRDCDPFRIRIDEGEAVVVLHADPRKNRNRAPGREIPLALTVNDGAFSVVPPRLIPAIDAFRPLIEKLRPQAQDQSPESKLRKDIEDGIKDGIESYLSSIDPDLVFNQPGHISSRVERLSLSDGWITVELSLSNVTPSVPSHAGQAGS